MTKKLILLQVAVALVCFSATAALAAGNPDTGPGCGLGKLAWADFGKQKNIGPQVLMATTNGTFGSQTFGISTGTSGCTNDGKVWAEYKVTMFAEINFDNLSQEMAQGHGEDRAGRHDQGVERRDVRPPGSRATLHQSLSDKGLPAFLPGAPCFRFAHDSPATTGSMAAGIPADLDDRGNRRGQRRRLSHRSDSAGA